MEKNRPTNHTALAPALAALNANGLKMTDSRRGILELLNIATRPQTAYQLREALSRRCRKDIKPATVYRALEALCAAGIVVRIESCNSFTLCHHVGHTHQHAFLVCQQCGTVTEIADHAAGAALTRSARDMDFQINRQILELHGLCRSCHA